MFIRADICAGGALYEEVYPWSNVSVKEKMGLSAGGLYLGGGGLTGEQIRYLF